MPEIGIFSQHQWRRKHMSWKSPKVIEIALGAEINCYACAEVK
jgi:coenzyme PQQ precursor peptide PqqA